MVVEGGVNEAHTLRVKRIGQVFGELGEGQCRGWFRSVGIESPRETSPQQGQEQHKRSDNGAWHGDILLPHAREWCELRAASSVVGELHVGVARAGGTRSKGCGHGTTGSRAK